MLQFYATLSKRYRAVVTIAVTLAVMLAFSMLLALLSDDIPSGFANKDFANYWIAGKLVLDGRVLDLFGSQEKYFSHLMQVFGDDYQWHNWSYPPHYLLLIWPLGFFGYKTGMSIFLVGTGLFYAWSLRAFAGRALPMVLVASGPFIVCNIWAAQNGFLTAALALGALALRARRPIIAGIMLGLLTVKPQLGILFPFLLLVEKRWLVIFSAVLTAAFLILVSAAVFGIDAWRGYFREIIPYQTLVMRNLDGAFLIMLPSLFGSFRCFGFDADAAVIAHAFLAVPAFAITVAAFFMTPVARWRAVLLLLGTFLVTPYALTYDLGMMSAALGPMTAPNDLGRKENVSTELLFTTAMLLPLWMIPLGMIRLPLAPVVLLSVWVVAIARAGIVPRALLRHIRAYPPQRQIDPAAVPEQR